MSKIRYKISPNVHQLGILQDDGSTKMIEFNHREHIYFVDLLDFNPIKTPEYGVSNKYISTDNQTNGGRLKKFKIYMPDGNDIEGVQSVDWVSLHHTGNIFDGRFNRHSD